jgi:hypothetical protein
MGMDPPLVDRDYLLKKFPGKGGWTYAEIPEIPPDEHAHFSWVRVKGSIDGVLLKGYHLMPSGKGTLFLPVKAATRKKIGKEAGDSVRVILYADPVSEEIPQALAECLEDQPELKEKFYREFPEARRKEIYRNIHASRNEAEQLLRLSDLLNLLETL